MYAGGWWKLSNKLAAKQGMDVKWFNQQGLHSLVKRMGAVKVSRNRRVPSGTHGGVGGQVAN